jgi:hypothetical protein
MDVSPIDKSLIKKLEPMVFFKSGVKEFLIYRRRRDVFPTASEPNKVILNLY